jgi:IclR family pca regulon transcriptional regulator
MTIFLAIGSRLPAYPTSMGRVLLAGLPPNDIDEFIARTSLEPLTPHTITDPERLRSTLEKVRADGYAMVDQELEEGVRSIAAPIRNGRGKVIAAMNISCHASRVTVAKMREEFRPPLLATANEISERIGLVLGS